MSYLPHLDVGTQSQDLENFGSGLGLKEVLSPHPPLFAGEKGKEKAIVTWLPSPEGSR